MKEAFAFFRRVNLRRLFERRLRSLLTISGVAAGVALIFSITVINATLMSTVRSSMRLLGGEAEIEVAATDLSGLPQDAVDRIGALEGVQRAVPMTRSISRTSGENDRAQGLWLGVTPDFASLFPKSTSGLHEISLSGGAGILTGGAILAESFADELGVGRGDRVLVQTPRGPRPVDVAGILSGSALQTVNGGDLAILALPAAQQLFAKTGRVDSIYVVTEPDVPVDSVETALEEELEGAASVGPPGERAAVFERSFGTLQLLTSMAGVVALFVALFVVYNTMSMSVTERQREVSLALALGMKRRRIFGAFFAEAGFIGLLASAIGIVAGLILARVLVTDAVDGYRFMLPETTSAPVSVRPTTVASALLGGVLVSLLGAFVPVRRILGVAPIEFLRPRAPFSSEAAGSRSLGAKAVLAVAALLTLGGMAAYRQTAASWLAPATLVALMTTVTLTLVWVVPWSIRVVRAFLRVSFGAVGRLAGDSLARNSGRATATSAALLLSLAMVVGVGSAIESYQAQIARSAQGWFGAPLYVKTSSFTGFGSDQPLAVGLSEDLEDAEGVAHAYPGRYGFVNVRGDQAIIYAISVAEAAEDGAAEALSSAGIDQDQFVDHLADGRVVVSRYAADAFDLEEGDAISLPTPSGRRDFVVGALFDDLVPFYSMYMEHRMYADLWNDRKADAFSLIPESGASLDSVASNVTEILEAKDLPAQVETRSEVIGDIGDVTEGLVSIARGIQLAALIVAALTIANTMFIAVLERRWEFGLSQAVGMSRAQLGKTVFLEAVGIGLIGSVGGVVFGTMFGVVMLVMMEQQFAWRVPFEAQWLLAIGAVIGGVVLAGASALYPRRVATRYPIVESLRYE